MFTLKNAILKLIGVIVILTMVFAGPMNIAAAPMRLSVVNPPLVQACGLDIVLVLDVSGSIDATMLAQMKTAFNAFVSAFLPATPTEMAVVKFTTTATVLQGFTSNPALLVAAINGASGGDLTNFDDGLYKARTLFPNRSNPDLIVFASDGNPNVKDGHPGTLPSAHTGTAVSATEATAEAWAAAEADIAKTAGIRIMTIGLGSYVTVSNLIGISGPTVYPTNTADIANADVILSDFSTLATSLADLAEGLCGGTVTVHKVIDADGILATTADQTTTGTTVSGWGYDANNVSSGDSVLPSGTPDVTTDSSGAATPFDVTIDGDNATLDILETVKAGYSFLGATCTKPGGTPTYTVDTDPVGGVGVDALTVGRQDIVSCTFYNTENVGSLKITKTVSNPGSAVLPPTFVVNYGCGIGYTGQVSVAYPAPGFATVPGIPVGNTCSVIEVAPGPITGFTWGTISYTPSSIAISTKGGTYEIVVGNSITRNLPGCGYTWGYWKNHSKYAAANGAHRDIGWDQTPLGLNLEDVQFYGNWEDPATKLNQLTWFETLKIAPKQGNAYLILAHQYVAAYLNINKDTNPANPTVLGTRMADALSLLTYYSNNNPGFKTYPPEIPKGAANLSSDDRAWAIQLAGYLDQFNNGFLSGGPDLGPTHCGD